MATPRWASAGDGAAWPSATTFPSTISRSRGSCTLGGTILSTSNFHPVKEQSGLERVRGAVDEDKIDGLIAIGGEHTMMINRQVMEEIDLPIVGVPKTIDNDVVGTDYTFGFHTAVQIATDAIDRLHSTAQSHDRVMVLEVMGRNSGWIAVFAGLAGGADAIVIPELELTVEEITEGIEHRHQQDKNFSIIVVAEGAELSFPQASGRPCVPRTRSTNTGIRALAESARRSLASSESARGSTRG